MVTLIHQNHQPSHQQDLASLIVWGPLLLGRRATLLHGKWGPSTLWSNRERPATESSIPTTIRECSVQDNDFHSSLRVILQICMILLHLWIILPVQLVTPRMSLNLRSQIPDTINVQQHDHHIFATVPPEKEKGNHIQFLPSWLDISESWLPSTWFMQIHSEGLTWNYWFAQTLTLHETLSSYNFMPEPDLPQSMSSILTIRRLDMRDTSPVVPRFPNQKPKLDTPCLQNNGRNTNISLQTLKRLHLRWLQLLSNLQAYFERHANTTGMVNMV